MVEKANGNGGLVFGDNLRARIRAGTAGDMADWRVDHRRDVPSRWR
jgi:hypothetical protein